MSIERGRMWAYCMGKDDKGFGCSPMFRQRSQFDHTLVPQGFTGTLDLTTWSQEDRAVYMLGYEGK